MVDFWLSALVRCSQLITLVSDRRSLTVMVTLTTPPVAPTKALTTIQEEMVVSLAHLSTKLKTIKGLATMTELKR